MGFSAYITASIACIDLEIEYLTVDYAKARKSMHTASEFAKGIT